MYIWYIRNVVDANVPPSKSVAVIRFSFLLAFAVSLIYACCFIIWNCVWLDRRIGELEEIKKNIALFIYWIYFCVEYSVVALHFCCSHLQSTTKYFVVTTMMRSSWTSSPSKIHLISFRWVSWLGISTLVCSFSFFSSHSFPLQSLMWHVYEVDSYIIVVYCYWWFSMIKNRCTQRSMFYREQTKKPLVNRCDT